MRVSVPDARAAVVALAAVAVLGTPACASTPPARGRLVVHVTVAGGLTPDGTVDERPGAGARVIVTGGGRTRSLVADARGVARARLAAGRYRVRLPASSSAISSPRRVTVRAGRTSTVRLTSACTVC